jgi:hypothetical protein
MRGARRIWDLKGIRALFFDYMGKLIPRSKEYTLMFTKVFIATLIIASSF